MITDCLFLTFMQLIGNVILTIPTLIRLLTRQQKLRVALLTYCIFATVVTLAVSLSHYASMSLSPSTQVLFKSVRLIPVIVGSIAILKQSPPTPTVVSVCFIVCGLVALAIGNFSGKTRFDRNGIAAIMLTLCLDAVFSNFAEKMLKIDGIPILELISVSYLVGSIISIASSFSSGMFQSNIDAIQNNPRVIMYLALFSIFAALGNLIFYLLIGIFGCIVATIILSLRGPIVSFIKLPKFGQLYIYAIILISVGFSLLTCSQKEEKEPDFGKYSQDNQFETVEDFKMVEEDICEEEV
ncbi:hypothetical protein TVAG_396180 [Trichomonas vaginalis G3]|uniref:Integral membrane protein n=1 Tax=Trichomonas vaginalis (strain ATCC PRA-98 / G3) TaxID=412133 RepID=A2ESC9_TRIV3|nr:3'-phosphoadenosine 5'-phosphosulfate transmembrane transporter protein [Trichomonas vaginalis G3]EAY04432.1 hypothetical protein TVAG_396180 [Trichomonas vaginalis G3]KAI5502206.1 3'-phosphoadenosine 5'-phosphosulfate transmembrane transporter protein [Trichomonas vaginalis G3]|eukprot:XP_001316655.1 hypothetical protein [Trichomonas vaginalis G3]